MESPGALPSRGLVFQLVCPFHRYWAFSSKSMVQPKMESCFQDRACSVCFLLQSLFLMLLTHSMSIIHRAVCTLTLQPLIWENRINLCVTKFIIHCKMKGPQSRTIKATITMVNIVFHQSPLTQDRTEVQKGRLSSDISFTWPFMSSRVADI